jgi:hypothetical protein
MQDEDQDQDGDSRLGNMSHTVKQKYRRKLRKSFVRTGIDGQAWFLSHICKVESSKKEQEMLQKYIFCIKLMTPTFYPI